MSTPLAGLRPIGAESNPQCNGTHECVPSHKSPCTDRNASRQVLLLTIRGDAFAQSFNGGASSCVLLEVARQAQEPSSRSELPASILAQRGFRPRSFRGVRNPAARLL